MTSALENIQKHFVIRHQEYSTTPPVIGNVAEIDKAVEHIKKRVGEIQGKPATDRIQEALSLVFNEGPKIALKSHLRYICWGLSEPWGNTNKRIITESDLFNKTLLEIQKIQSSEIPMSAWRGLLAAYFGYEESFSSTKNWLALRDMLSVHFKTIKNQKKFQPSWLIVLEEHEDLLSETPCERYGNAILSGNDSILVPLRDELKIPNTSWFWDKLFLSQVKIATEKNDNEFISLLDRLLSQIVNFKFSSDTALKMMLERYQQSNQRNIPHIPLRESAIESWGSPHLQMNARWGAVKAEAKLMVKTWLVTKALEDFFNLLQADRAADERRLNFWLRYQQSIDYFHFALGPDAATNRQTDYVSFKNRFRDHICNLTSPGQRSNNAFILSLGNYLVIEFGVTGNACYIYEKNKILLDLSIRRPLDLNYLKDKRKVLFHLSHQSGWEYNFEQRLERIGIYPDKKLNQIQQPLNKNVNNEYLGEKITPKLKQSEKTKIYSQANENIFITAGIKIAEMYSLETEDFRSKGGAFWVRFDIEKGLVAEKLHRAGFKYYAGRGWWKK